MSNKWCIACKYFHRRTHYLLETPNGLSVTYFRTVVEKAIVPLDPQPKLELNDQDTLKDQLEADKQNWKDRVPEQVRNDKYKGQE